MRRLRPIPVPPWAEPLEPLEHQQFLGAVRETLDALDEAHLLDEDNGVVTFEATGAVLDLRDPVAACAQERSAGRERWVEIVTGAVRRVVVEPDDLDGVLATPGRVRAHLKVQLFTEAEIEQGEADVVRRAGPPGTAQVLVLDLAHTVVALPAGSLPPDADVDELWTFAFDHTAEVERPEIDAAEVAEGVPVLVLQTAGVFGAANALWVERFFDPTPEGALVAIPSRHVVLVHPLRDTGAMTALGALASEALRLSGEGPDPLVSYLYWWRPGGLWTQIETWTDDNGLNLRVGDDLGTLLSHLPQGAPGTPPPPDLPPPSAEDTPGS